MAGFNDYFLELMAVYTGFWDSIEHNLKSFVLSPTDLPKRSGHRLYAPRQQ